MESGPSHVCHDCRARAPVTDTNYTLISSRYGWRLTRHVDADGSFRVEWRCPRCWERYKRGKLPSSTPVDGVAAITDLRASRPTGAAPTSPPRLSSRPPASSKKKI